MTGGREKENEMLDQRSLQKLKYIHTGNSHFIRTSMKRKASPATWKEVSGCGDMITSTAAPEG